MYGVRGMGKQKRSAFALHSPLMNFIAHIGVIVFSTLPVPFPFSHRFSSDLTEAENWEETKATHKVEHRTWSNVEHED